MDEIGAGDYYDRHGNPIGLMRWAELFEDFPGRLIGNDTVGPYRVSTIWLGLDHSFGHGPPLIFESMVFGPESVGAFDLDCQRYSTEEEARAGHEALVTLVRATVQTADDVLADQPQCAAANPTEEDER